MTSMAYIRGYAKIYQLSGDGNVFNKCTGRRLKIVKHHSGYSMVCLSKDGVQKTHFIHRLVLETFVGRCPKGMEACHNDGNRQNNTIGNLRWGTRTDNQADRINHGTSNRGERNGNATMTECLVHLIRQLSKFGSMTGVAIAKALRLNVHVVHSVISRRRWAHI